MSCRRGRGSPSSVEYSSILGHLSPRGVHEKASRIERGATAEKLLNIVLAFLGAVWGGRELAESSERQTAVPEVPEGRKMSRRRFLTYAGIGAGVAAVAGAGGYWLLSRPPPPLQWWGVGTGNPEQDVWPGLGDQVIFTTAPWDPVPVLQRMRTGGKNEDVIISKLCTMVNRLTKDGSILPFAPP